MWTSGTALVSDKHEFYWLSTGKKVQFTNWLVNQPDNYGNKEKCLHVIYDAGLFDTLLWNDHVCTTERYVICETTLPKSMAKVLTNNDDCSITLVNVPAE